VDHSLLVTVGRRCCYERLTEIALGSGDLTYDSTKLFELREHGSHPPPIRVGVLRLLGVRRHAICERE